jgi:hypothetical protein
MFGNRRRLATIPSEREGQPLPPSLAAAPFLKFLSRTRWLRPGRFGASRTPSSRRPGGAYTTYLLNYELFTSRLQNASASGKLSVSFSERLVVATMAKERTFQGPGSMTEPVCKALFASVAQSLAI